MITCKLDKTGEIFDTMGKLAKRLGCVSSNVTFAMQYKKDGKNHFKCRGEGITILQTHRPNYRTSEKGIATQKAYYAAHREYYKEYCRKWRKENPDKVKAQKEAWRKEHKEWFNEYYRKWRKAHAKTTKRSTTE